MVTATQLQIVQSPITALISTISTSVNVKLDDSNYLNWHFQIQLLLESNGIMQFVDGSHPCPAQHSGLSGDSTCVEADDFLIWKMHDRAIMQLITATLSPVALSCAIGSTSSRDLWTRLQEQFSTVSKTSIFQLKSNLQTIKKGADSVSQYLHRIKEARDYLSAAGVYFADEDIVILALNGLPSEYNTFRCVIRGRENVISLKEFRSQLLAEETIIETSTSAPCLSAMVANHVAHSGRSYSSPPESGSASFFSGGSQRFRGNKFKGRGRFNQGSRSFSPNQSSHFTPDNFPTPNSGLLGPSPTQIMGTPRANFLPRCQTCNVEGHTAPFCPSKYQASCQICGKLNHSTWYCFYNDKGPNFGGSPRQRYSSQLGGASNFHASFQHSPMQYQTASTQSQYPQALHTTMPPSSSASSNPHVWLADSGATNHMTADLSNLSLASPYPTSEIIQTANGEGLTVSHIGSSILTPSKLNSMHSLTLKSVLCVPRLTHNLVSVHRLCLDNNCWLIFDATCFWIQDKATGRILYKGLCRNGLYPIPCLAASAPTTSPVSISAKAFIGQHIQSSLWHHRLGHPSNPIVSLMLKTANISCSHSSLPVMCASCLEGKFCKLPFSPSSNKSVKPFEVVHSDLWGPSPSVSIDGYKFYVTFIDEYTRYCWLFPLANKSDVFATFVNFYSFILTQFTTPIRTLQSDGGGEYLSKAFQSFLLAKGIKHQLSCPYTPEQNGLAERKHRHIIETTVTLLQTASLPANFWSYACQTAIYLINRMPSSVLGHKSPFELLFGDIPGLLHLRIFGCACYPLLRPYNTTKLQAKTTQCIFLGYATKYKGYICYEGLTRRLYVSRHVVFDETKFPYPDLVMSHQLPCVSSISHGSLPSAPIVSPGNVVVAVPHVSAPIPVSPLLSSTSTSSSRLCSPVPVALVNDSESSAVVSDSDTLQVVLEVPPLNLHPMQTRSKSGIVKSRALLAAVQESGSVDLSLIEPVSYKSALKNPTWFKAMQEEFRALLHQGTWSLVDLPSSKNLVGCKWIFKIKRHSDGTIARHKARLVAQGFSQEPGIDYGETFSPVVKPTTVRLVLALAAHFGWSLRQLDVTNAFLHGILEEEVYMVQPPGFVDTHHPTRVCKLHKSLYGLKQAPRAWNERFTKFLVQLGFQNTYSDSSLFVQQSDSGILILLLYVDDIIITGTASTAVQQVIAALTHEFDLKDLGDLNFFLGIQISCTTTGLFLSQSKYVVDLLTKTDMVDSKPCATPCLPHHRLLKDDGDPYPNPTLYRSIVGALQYLTFTRPDIAFSVHQVCQFMQAPMNVHFTAVKRILRYLKGTLHHGLGYSRGSLQLKAFSDADWAGDPNDRRSTTGFVVFLGNNPVAWSSKKQLTVSRSSTEAEYRALSSTSAELDWIQQLLAFLHVSSPSVPVLFCDNLSAIALSFNPVNHQRTKHIEVDVHFVRERVARHQLSVQFVSSSEQFADILTKGLSAPLFHTHCHNLTLCSYQPEFAGG